VVAGKSTAQDYGSAVSYAKRYSLTGLLNLIIADEDDDANTVSVNGFAGGTGVLNQGANMVTFSPNYNPSVTRATPPSTPTSDLPPLPQDKYDAMVKFIADGKIKEVESAIKKYSLNESQKKLLTTMINQSKAEAITKSVKK
jgi:hypothetical protein